MSFVSMSPSGNAVCFVTAPIRPGITALESLVWELPASTTSVKLGANVASPDGTNANGKECDDEKWLEAKIAGGSWTPIGGGYLGILLDVSSVTTAEIRLNIPEGTQTKGDFVAALEIFFI